MRPCKLVLAVVALVVALHGLTPEAGAGAGAVGRCETDKGSGKAITIIFLTKDFALDPSDGQHIIVNNITVLAEFKGETFGSFTASGEVFGVLSAVDAGCAIFNELGLSSQILAATGLDKKATELNFTKCSFIGPASDACTKPKETPPGWVQNQIIGYAGD